MLTSIQSSLTRIEDALEDYTLKIGQIEKTVRSIKTAVIILIIFTALDGLLLLMIGDVVVR
jgi:hypothetical protein